MRILKKIALGVMLWTFDVCACDNLDIENWLKEVKEAKMDTHRKIELVNKCQIANFRLDNTPEYNAMFWMLEHAKHGYSLQLHKEAEFALFLRKMKE